MSFNIHIIIKIVICIAKQRTGKHLATRNGMEKTPLPLLLRNHRVYRLLWHNDSCMVHIRHNIIIIISDMVKS
jgi:hypothetical protein